MRRRTTALLELAIACFGLLVDRYLWAERRGEPTGRSPFWIGIGAASSIGYHWLYDRDVGGVRTNRLRRALATGGWAFLSNRLLPRTRRVTFSFVVGSNVGTIAYRLRYGLLRPLPESSTEP